MKTNFFFRLAAAPRHLKKAWLQRHNTGEDYDNSTQISNSVKKPLSQQCSTIQSTITTDSTMTFNDDKEDAFKATSAHSNNGNSLAVNNFGRKPGKLKGNLFLDIFCILLNESIRLSEFI